MHGGDGRKSDSQQTPQDKASPDERGPFHDDNLPPLDWRVTPRNVILQLGAVALFLGVFWFLWDLMISGFAVLFR